MRKNKFLELFLTFMKIGLFTFGGGYAMIPLIEHTCVEKKGWITHDEMMNITVIAESTPGPIATNCATFVGFGQAGLPGAAAATFGIVLPSFLIIFAISMCLDNFLEIPVIAKAFQGIKIAVGLLIFDAAVTMIKKMNRRAFSIVVLVCSFGAMLAINIFSMRISSMVLMLLAAVVSLVLVKVGPGRKGGKEV